MEITEVHAPRLDTLDGQTGCDLSTDTWRAYWMQGAQGQKTGGPEVSP